MKEEQEEDLMTESDHHVNQDLEIPKPPPKKIRLHEYEDNPEPAKERNIRKGAFLANNYPSYCLKQGFGSSLRSEGGESLRSEHRKRLWRLLNKLMKRQNWAEASGVLSVLLQATVNDKSASRNRVKYSAALELLSHINGESISSERGSKFYDLWLKKIGARKNWAPKNKFAVKLESIIFSLQHGITNKISYDKLKELTFVRMEDYHFEDYPLSDLVKGLMFYHLWFRSLTELDSPGTPMQSLDSPGTSMQSPGTSMQSEMPTDDIHVSFGYSRENYAPEAGGANSSTTMQIDANTSVDNLSKETSHPSFQSQESHLHSAQGGGHNDHPFSNYSGDFPHASIFDSRGLPPWLLPLKLPNSHKNLEDIYKKSQNKLYELALKHLHDALYSTNPVIEAFHPLIQMLLLGDRVPKALDELENISHNSATVLQLRLKANVLEHFDVGNYVRLSTCCEDILKKDPTCNDSLSKLVDLHRRGDYDTQSLAEMLASHLDVTRGICDTWKELASCFLKLSRCEDDRLSICCDATDQYMPEDLDNPNKIPELFTNGDSDWRLRCKSWLNRHFHNDMLLLDIASGDLELLTYKASSASHLYGRHFRYVLKATECLEKEDNMDLYSILQMHIINSIGFYSL